MALGASSHLTDGPFVLLISDRPSERAALERAAVYASAKLAHVGGSAGLLTEEELSRLLAERTM